MEHDYLSSAAVPSGTFRSDSSPINVPYSAAVPASDTSVEALITGQHEQLQLTLGFNLAKLLLLIGAAISVGYAANSLVHARLASPPALPSQTSPEFSLVDVMEFLWVLGVCKVAPSISAVFVRTLAELRKSSDEIEQLTMKDGD